MKKLLWTISLGAVAILHAETNATMLLNGNEDALLVDKNRFYVKVVDEVTGGCLPKPEQLKRSMEQALKNDGFEVVKKRDFLTPEVYISTLGFRSNRMCVVDFSVSILFPIIAEVPNAQHVPSGNRTIVTYSYDIGRHIFHYQKYRMQQTLNKYVKTYGDKIYIKIAKAKDDIFAKFPEMREEIERKRQSANVVGK